MESDFSIGVRVLYVEHRDGLSWNYSDLAAPYWRFYWNLKGRSRVFGLGDDGTGHMPLRIETGYLISPDTDFSCESDGILDQFFIHFTLDRKPVGVGKGVFALDDDRILKQPVFRILDLLSQPPAVASRGQLLYQSAGLVLAALSCLELGEAIHLVPDERVVRAVEFINANTDKPVSAREICAASGCAERTLRRLFLSGFGVTPVNYSIARRIDAACIHLHFSDASIDEIAASTGFCDRYHFTRVFTKVRGISPAVFRNIAIEPTATASGGRVRTGFRHRAMTHL